MIFTTTKKYNLIPAHEYMWMHNADLGRRSPKGGRVMWSRFLTIDLSTADDTQVDTAVPYITCRFLPNFF